MTISFPFIRVIAGNLLPCLILPKLYHCFVFKSKNSKDESDELASEDPPATTIPFRPLNRTFVQECCNDQQINEAFKTFLFWLIKNLGYFNCIIVDVLPVF